MGGNVLKTVVARIERHRHCLHEVMEVIGKIFLERRRRGPVLVVCRSKEYVTRIPRVTLTFNLISYSRSSRDNSSKNSRAVVFRGREWRLSSTVTLCSP